MKNTLDIGDYVRHKITAQLGQVIAYGHQIIGSNYLPTLKVEVVGRTNRMHNTFIEDLYDVWVLVENDETTLAANTGTSAMTI